MKKLKMKKYSEGTSEVKEDKVKKKKPSEMSDEELKTAKKNAVAVSNRTTDTSIYNKYSKVSAKTTQGGEANDRDKRVIDATNRAKELDQEYQRRNKVDAKGKPKMKDGSKAITLKKKMKLTKK